MLCVAYSIIVLSHIALLSFWGHQMVTLTNGYSKCNYNEETFFCSYARSFPSHAIGAYSRILYAIFRKLSLPTNSLALSDKCYPYCTILNPHDKLEFLDAQEEKILFGLLIYRSDGALGYNKIKRHAFWARRPLHMYLIIRCE